MKHWTLTAIVILCMSMFAATSAMSKGMKHHDTYFQPVEHMQGSVRYMTGGIGKDEARAMRRAESKYSLSMEFDKHFSPKAEFFGEADVRIKDSAGRTVLNTQTDGPYLMANLPAGQYTVWARAEGKWKAESKHVTVGAGRPTHLVFMW